MSEQEKTPRLPPGQQLVTPQKWPYVGERSPRDSDEPWSLTFSGLVNNELTFSMSELAGFPQTELTTDIHCVTRWSKFDVQFSGILLSTLLDELDIVSDDRNARFISFVARTDRQHRSSMKLDEAIECGCLLATHFQGLPLAVDHGGPLRGVVPGRYFYKSVKWIERIELLEHDVLGHWEAESGYHNHADPWQEQRYVASSITRKQARMLVESKDFSDQELLGINVNGLNLTRLNAQRATLRNAGFQQCCLAGANFSNANLTNSSFRSANLALVNFGDADLEGADFASADLRGADLRGCSLFGTSFFDGDGQSRNNAAKLDETTLFTLDSLERLTEAQREFIQQAIGIS